MKLWLPCLIVIIVGVYLNRAYSHIYSTIGHPHLTPPTNTITFDLPGIGSSNASLTLVTLGDSLMAGVGSSNQYHTLAYLLAQKRAKNYESVHLINLAQPGATTQDVLSYQIPQLTDLSPQEVILLIGVNDIHNFVSLSQFEKNYQQIIQLLSETNTHLTVITIPYLGSNLLLYPPYPWYFDYQTQRYNRVIKTIAQDQQLPLIDLYEKSKQPFSQNPTLYYASDQFHPSDEGYRLWEKLIDAD